MRHSTCAHRRTRREDSMEDLQKDKDQGEKLRSLVEVSRKNDIPALLNAKNRAQQDVYSDPSKENLAVLERATAMLEKAMDAGQNCKNWKEALTYLQEDCGRKIGQTKLFADIKAGRLRKQPDGTFKRRDLDRYAASLPTAGTPDKLATDAARRQREKEEQEIRRIRVAADKEEFILKVKQGQYISRDDVYQELAARAVALSASLKTEFEARSLDVIALVEGYPSFWPRWTRSSTISGTSSGPTAMAKPRRAGSWRPARRTTSRRWRKSCSGASTPTRTAGNTRSRQP